MKSNRSYYYIIGGLFLLFILLQFLRPRETDWSPSFSKYHSKPYGNEALFKAIEDLFPDNKITVLRKTTTEFFGDSNYGEVNYILITSNAYFPESDWEALMSLAYQGGNVFIAANSMRLENALVHPATEINTWFVHDSLKSSPLYFTNTALSALNTNRMQTDLLQTYFADPGPEYTVLSKDSLGNAYFIKYEWGKGAIYFHSSPLVFTNFNLLKDNNSTYISGALSYLPERDVIWDEYFNSGREGSQSEIKFILDSPSLRTAWYVIFGLLLIFFVFQGKRRQKVIPVIVPPKNTTLEFIETVGQLYLSQRNYQDLIQKKIHFFLDSVRERFHMQTQNLGSEFQQKLHLRSGVPMATIQAVFHCIERNRLHPENSKQALIELNNQIELFNEKSQR